MIKSLIVSMLLLAGFSSFAQSSNPWVVAYEATESSKSPAGFEMLKQKYPNYFSQWQADQVDTANINTKVYEFKGATTCPSNDPKLLFTTRGYGLCEKYKSGNASCFQTVEMMPSPNDPCAN